MKTTVRSWHFSDVIPAKAGIQCLSGTHLALSEKQSRWIPAFAGMTNTFLKVIP